MYKDKTKEVIRVFKRLEDELENIIRHEDGTKFFWLRPFEKTLPSLKDNNCPFVEDVEEIAQMDDDCFGKYDINIDTIKPKCKELYERVISEIKMLESNKYNHLIVNNEYYKVKSVFYEKRENEDGNEEKVIRFIIASFYSWREHDLFLTNLQKGYRSNRLSDKWGRDNYLIAEKNGYISKQKASKDINNADGVHAVIYSMDDNMLFERDGKSPVDLVYRWLDKKFHVPLLNLPLNADSTINERLLSEIVDNTNTDREGYINEVNKWKEYFYNALSDKGLIKECEGFDLTGKAPNILTISKEVTEELIWELAKTGIKEGFIKIPVDEIVPLSKDITFTDFIMDRVLPYINNNEELYYKVGDPINPILQSDIVFEDTGEVSKLFPRQQVIAQGFLNYLKDVINDPLRDNSAFVNGGMGVGKTFIDIKLTFAIMKEIYGREHGRVVLYCQGHLIPKWQRQFREALTPIGIDPIFYEINSFKDVYNIPLKPQGFEVILMPKDRAKRSYMKDYSNLKKWNSKAQLDVYKCVKSIVSEIENAEINKKEGEVSESIIVRVVDIPVRALKLTARKLEKELKRPVILLKKQVNSEGKIIGYKVATTSNILKGNTVSNMPYDFIWSEEEKTYFLNRLKDKNDILGISMVKEYKNTEMRYRSSYAQNGYICPICGSLQYKNADEIFDRERHYDNIYFKPKKPQSRNSSNLKCNSFVKADGTPLFEFEKREIRRGHIDIEVVDKKVLNPYIDMNGNNIVGEDLRLVKANKYPQRYKILLSQCNYSMWGAIDKRGYRSVNSADVMLKRFGRKSIDFAIYDEFHIMARQSQQGIVFGKLCELSKLNIGLTGTLSGGKASDLFYILWRMMGKTMRLLGYKYEDVTKFVDHYGRRKKVVKVKIKDEYNKTGSGKKNSSGWLEIAGISPLLYNNFFSGTMICRTLQDMNIPLPELKYFKHEIEMDEELKKSYENLKEQFVTVMKDSEENFAGSYLHTLLRLPDSWDHNPIYYKKDQFIIARPKKINTKRLFPKELKLLETIKKERKENRRVLLYSIYSGEKGVSNRLIEIISQAGYKVAELKSSIDLSKREEWIKEQYDKGIEVIITNPVNVETGLDIIQYPTVYFYGMGYNVKTIRQAEVRPYRVSQKNEVRIYYSYYKDTLQEDAIKLVGAKKKASLALEGIFSEDMLSQLGDSEDNGSQVLFKVLKGKIKLREEELDVFNFQSDSEMDEINYGVDIIDLENDMDEIPHEYLDYKPFGNSSELNNKEITFYTVTEEDIKVLKKRMKKKKDICEGQMSLFAI